MLASSRVERDELIADVAPVRSTRAYASPPRSARASRRTRRARGPRDSARATRSDARVRLARRRPARYQRVGDVGRDRVAVKRGALHRRAIEAHGFPRARESARASRARPPRSRSSGSSSPAGRAGTKAPVRRASPAHRHTRPTSLRRMRAHQLERIGVALLRHQARAGRRGIAEPHVTERRRRPGDELFGDARGINDGADACVREIERHIAIADRIERVARRTLQSRAPAPPRSRSSGKPEPASAALPSGHERAARVERRREPLGRAHERFAPRREHKGEQHRLRRLPVRAAREHRLRRGARRQPARRAPRDGVRHAARRRGRGRARRAAASSRPDRCGCARRAATRRRRRQARARARRSHRGRPPHRSRARRPRTCRRRSRLRPQRSAARNDALVRGAMILPPSSASTCAERARTSNGASTRSSSSDEPKASSCASARGRKATAPLKCGHCRGSRSRVCAARAKASSGRACSAMNPLAARWSKASRRAVGRELLVVERERRARRR